MFKKIISMILVAAMAFSVLSIYCFAEDINVVYDEYGNAYEIPEDAVLVVIRDMYGNVVNTNIARSESFLDGKYTIPANGSMMTYKYESHHAFYAGFMRYLDGFDLGTDPNRRIRLTVYKTAAVNSLGIIAEGPNYYNTSTSPYDGTNGFVGIEYNAEAAYPYYYAVYENLENTSVTLHLLVGRHTA